MVYFQYRRIGRPRLDMSLLTAYRLLATKKGPTLTVIG